MKGMIAVGCFFFSTVLANYFLKVTVMATGQISVSQASLMTVLFQSQFYYGMLCYGIAAAAWVVTLSFIPMNIATTISALVYVVIILVSFFVFAEPISILRWIGIMVVFIGIIIIGWSV